MLKIKKNIGILILLLLVIILIIILAVKIAQDGRNRSTASGKYGVDK